MGYGTEAIRGWYESHLMFVVPFGAVVAPLFVMWFSVNFNAALTEVIVLHSIQYIACMPPFMLVFLCWMMSAYLLYCTSKRWIPPAMCTPQVVNGQFLPAKCTPQKEWFKRARSFLDVCSCVCPLPQAGLYHIRVVTLAWGGLCGQLEW